MQIQRLAPPPVNPSSDSAFPGRPGAFSIHTTERNSVPVNLDDVRTRKELRHNVAFRIVMFVNMKPPADGPSHGQLPLSGSNIFVIRKGKTAGWQQRATYNLAGACRWTGPRRNRAQMCRSRIHTKSQIL